MTFNPLVPTGLVNLDEDYKNLQINFNQSNVHFGIDHKPFTDTTAAKGYHTVIHQVPFSTTTSNPPNNQPIIAPAATPAYGEVFSAQINDGISTDEALFFQSGGGRITQLTRNFQPVLLSNGATSLPGGLILNWGTFSIPLLPIITSFSASNTANFLIPFPTACLNIFFSYKNADSSTEVFTYTKSNTLIDFVWRIEGSKSASTTSPLIIFWQAMGT